MSFSSKNLSPLPSFFLFLFKKIKICKKQKTSKISEKAKLFFVLFLFFLFLRLFFKKCFLCAKKRFLSENPKTKNKKSKKKYKKPKLLFYFLFSKKGKFCCTHPLKQQQKTPKNKIRKK